jgi:RNA polymerase sigma factor (sigma-70 family)
LSAKSKTDAKTHRLFATLERPPAEVEGERMMSIVVISGSYTYAPADVSVADDLPNVRGSERLLTQSRSPATAPGKFGSGNESGSRGSPSEQLGSPASLSAPPPAVSSAPPSLPAPDPQSDFRCGSTSLPASARTFEHAILPHLDAAYNLARWLTRDPVVAEDIVQDALLRALQYFESFHGENGRAWLLRIVRNAAYTKLRPLRAGVEVALGSAENGAFGMDVADPDPGPEAALATNEDLARLEAAMAALPINLRECLLLREMEELSYKEIARIAEIPIGTVMSRLCRARRMLMASWTADASARATAVTAWRGLQHRRA